MPESPAEPSVSVPPLLRDRFAQWVLIISLVPFSWLGMMLVHELGHVAAALATGGTVTRLVWHPLVISRTDISPNPHPLAVVWAGPLIGVLVPLGAWGVVALLTSRWSHIARFFAGFCLVANGAYIGGGSFGRYADAGDMLNDGSPIWLLWLFGVASVATGLALWNGLGRYFGLGSNAQPISRLHAWVMLGLLCATLIAGFVWGDRGM